MIKRSFSIFKAIRKKAVQRKCSSHAKCPVFPASCTLIPHLTQLPLTKIQLCKIIICTSTQSTNEKFKVTQIQSVYLWKWKYEKLRRAFTTFKYFFNTFNKTLKSVWQPCKFIFSQQHPHIGLQCCKYYHLLEWKDCIMSTKHIASGSVGATKPKQWRKYLTLETKLEILKKLKRKINSWQLHEWQEWQRSAQCTVPLNMCPRSGSEGQTSRFISISYICAYKYICSHFITGSECIFCS